MRHDWHIQDEISEVIKYPCTQFFVRTFSVTSEHEPIKLLFMLPLPPLGKQQSQNDCGYFTVRVIFYNWHLGLLSLSFSIPLEFPLILLMSLCIEHPDGVGNFVVYCSSLIGWIFYFFFYCTVRQPPVLHMDEWAFAYRKGTMYFIPQIL